MYWQGSAEDGCSIHAAAKSLRRVAPQPGRPLYLASRDAIRDAIDAGAYAPGEQIPSTKELSEQLGVSLVTAHRALQELVSAGVLQRSQGKGTFVHPRYYENRKSVTELRIGLVLHSEVSLANHYHSHMLEGIRQAAQAIAADLIFLRFGEDVRKECNGYLFMNPLPSDLEAFGGDSNRRHPVMVVGAKSHVKRICSIDIDNMDLARQAVAHLVGLGHTRIGYIGSADRLSNSRDRYQGFRDACRGMGLASSEAHVMKGSSYRLLENERNEMVRMLSAPSRPTAFFATGYYIALDVYAAATTVGLRIPQDLSIVGVDDPVSAAHVSPPMTTLRQPLIEMGHAALSAICDRIRDPRTIIESRQLRAQLIIRNSTGPISSRS